MLLQIITDPSTLGAVERYLPTFAILCLGGFAFYMIKFMRDLIDKEHIHRQASVKAIEDMGDAVKGLSDNVTSNFTDLKIETNNIRTTVDNLHHTIKS